MENTTTINAIGASDYMDQAKENQQLLWEREDQIRRETQAREDSAAQRAVEDYRKAGINPNLVGFDKAESGGGITQASKQEELLGTIFNTLTNENLELLTLGFEKLKHQNEMDLAIDEHKRLEREGIINAAIGAIKAVGEVIPG